MGKGLPLHAQFALGAAEQSDDIRAVTDDDEGAEESGEDQSLDDGAGSPDNVEFAVDDPVIVGFAICAKGGPGEATATAVDIKINGKDAMAVQPADKLLTTWAEIRKGLLGVTEL